jgi:hypothetical protein
MTMEESEYQAATDRKIYCPDPDKSYFRLKSITSFTPYLEMPLYGVQVGDVVTVEFEARLISGTVKLEVRQINILEGNVVEASHISHNIPTPVHEFYKKYKVVFPIRSNQYGALVNVRTAPSVGDSEIVIRNVVLKVDSSNPNFALYNPIVSYRDQTDFMRVIKYISGTDVRTVYNGLLSLYDVGQVSLADNGETLVSSGSTSGRFRGLCAQFPENKYPNPVAVYFEYKNDNSEQLKVTLNGYNAQGSFTVLANKDISLSTSSWRKSIHYVAGPNQAFKKLFADVGRAAVAVNFKIRNVRFSNPRFDDYVFGHKEPNRIDDLYTNLGDILRKTN